MRRPTPYIPRERSQKVMENPQRAEGKTNVKELAKRFQDGTIGLNSLMPADPQPVKPAAQKPAPPVDTFTELQIALAKRRAKMEGQ